MTLFYLFIVSCRTVPIAPHEHHSGSRADNCEECKMLRRMKQAELEERAALALEAGEVRPAWVSAWGSDAPVPRFAYMRSANACSVALHVCAVHISCFSCSVPHMDPDSAMIPERAREGGGFRTGPGSWKTELPRLINRTSVVMVSHAGFASPLLFCLQPQRV